LSQIEQKWRLGTNMVPVIMHALRQGATMGEIHVAMRGAQGIRR
jgi:hypothetical protein